MVIRRSRVVRNTLWVVSILFMLVGLMLFAGSMLPGDVIRAQIDPHTWNESDAGAYWRFLFRIRSGAFLLLLFGVFLLFRKNTLQGYGEAALESLTSFLSNLKNHVMQIVAQEHKAHLVSLIGILLVAVSARVAFLVVVSDYNAPNNHIFHTFLVRAMFLLFGEEPWSLRIPSLIAGILIVLASYIVVRILYDKYAALLTAAVVAGSSYLIVYSTSARGYSLLTLIFLICLALAAHVVTHERSGAWYFLAIAFPLGFYTIPTMLYAFSVTLVWTLLSATSTTSPYFFQRRKLWRQVIVLSMFTIISSLLLYFPAILFSGWDAIVTNEIVAPRTWSSFLGQIPASLSAVWNTWNRDLPLGVSIALLVGFIASLLNYRKISNSAVSLPAAILLGTEVLFSSRHATVIMLQSR